MLTISIGKSKLRTQSRSTRSATVFPTKPVFGRAYHNRSERPRSPVWRDGPRLPMLGNLQTNIFLWLKAKTGLSAGFFTLLGLTVGAAFISFVFFVRQRIHVAFAETRAGFRRASCRRVFSRYRHDLAQLPPPSRVAEHSDAPPLNGRRVRRALQRSSIPRYCS